MQGKDRLIRGTWFTSYDIPSRRENHYWYLPTPKGYCNLMTYPGTPQGGLCTPTKSLYQNYLASPFSCRRVAAPQAVCLLAMGSLIRCIRQYSMPIGSARLYHWFSSTSGQVRLGNEKEAR